MNHHPHSIRHYLLKWMIICLLIVLTGKATHAQENGLTTDSVNHYLRQQLLEYPQEKIYLQTDKAAYLSGERIWFRAHKVDALTHIPATFSRYIYVELVNPLDDLVKRVKIRPDSSGIYAGHLDLDEELPQGNYTLRAYTQYMRNSGEEYFFRRMVSVLDPFSLQIEPEVSFRMKKNKIEATFCFLDRQNGDTILPEVVNGKLGHGKVMKLKSRDNNRYTLEEVVPETEQKPIFLLGLIWNGRKYNRYYSIPTDPEEFAVSFFPEGGYLIPGVTSMVAFKSLGADGMGKKITGTVYDSTDKEILTFNSFPLGMGFFHFIPTANETYYAICRTEQGISKRFDLPNPNSSAIVLSARVTGNRLRITRTGRIADSREEMSLLIHRKGEPILHQRWDPGVEIYTFPTEKLPDGISQILLLNSQREVLSERMIFNLNGSELTQIESESLQPNYRRRELVRIPLKLTDNNFLPATGNIAVAVTDKNSVVTDSTTNLISTLLLTSELKGYIESPASYFPGGKVDKYAIDALMLTQGWKRYEIPAVLKGEIEKPETFAPELAHRITGSSDRLIGSMKDGQISLMAKLDTLVSYQTTLADEKGRFSFLVEYPEGTTILVQSRSKRGGSMNVISLDPQTFPTLERTSLAQKAEWKAEENIEDAYLKIANEAYTMENGIRTILLDEFTVTAKSLEKYKESTYYSPIYATGVQTAEDIEKMAVSSLRALLYRQPGILFRGDQVTTTRSEQPVLFIIDNMQFEDFSSRLDDIDVSSIESIFVLRDNTSMPGFFPNTSGAVVITTKIGGYQGAVRRPPSIDEIVPLGYQQPAAFYEPVYETNEQKGNSQPDLRTTISWKPSLQFNEAGEALIEFYSADMPTQYLITGEGVSDSGKLIHFTREIPIVSSEKNLTPSP